MTSPGQETVTVTVLFTDVVGSTAFRTHVGDARADAYLLELERVSRDVVTAHGGQIVKGLGDGVMATFSSGVAALEAAGTLQILVDRFYRPAGLQLRFGVSSGDLVREAMDWHGVAAIEASRLCAEAAGGSVLVSASTVLLARGRTGSELRRLGERYLRGFATPIGVFELSPPRDDGLPAALAALAPVRLIGRSAEVAAGQRVLDHVAAGASGNLLVLGEPGVGKSSTAHAISQKAAESGLVVLYGHCDEGLRAPYQPIIEAFGSWLAACPDTALSRVLGGAGPELATLWPELTRRVPGLSSLAEADPQTQRWRLFDAVVSLAEVVAAGRGLLLVLDDLHWSEPATVLMLRHLCDARLPRVGVVVTARDRDIDSDGSSVVAEIERIRDLGVVRLGGLTAGDVREFIEAQAGESPPERISCRLQEQTGGNPFFLGALLAHLEEAGLLRPTGDWATEEQLREVAAPSEVRLVIERRLARLSAGERQAFAAAAVIGQTFAVTTVAAVLGMGLDEAIDALDGGAQAGLLREQAPGSFGFAHAIVRQATVASLSLTRVARLHWRVAEELEREVDGGSARLGEIAYHYDAGRHVGDPGTVVRTALAAGDDAMRRFAFEEATRHFRLALVSLDVVPADETHRYRVLVSLAEALNCLTDTDAAQPLWLEAAELARCRRDIDDLNRAFTGYSYMLRLVPDPDADRLLDQLVELLPPGDSPMRARALAWKASRTWSRDPELASQALDMARRTGDSEAVMGTLGSTVWLESGGPDAQAMLAAAESLAEMPETDESQSARRAWTATRNLVWARMRLGRREEAEEALAKCHRLALETRQGIHTHNTMIWDASIAIAEGRFSDGKRLAADAQKHGGAGNAVVALAYGAQILAARMEQGAIDKVISGLRQLDVLLDHLPAWRAMLVGAVAEAGDHSRAAAELGQLLDRGDSYVPPDQTAPLAVRYLCEVSLQVRNTDAAKVLRPHVAPWAGQLLVVTMGTSIEGAADRSIGHLLATLGLLDEADAAYRSAAQLELAAGFRPLAARTHYWQARALLERRSSGDRELAEELLGDVVSVSRELGMDLLGQQAAHLEAL